MSLLRGTFRAGITLKGIDGVLEAVGGVLVWFVKPAELASYLQMMCQHELSRDPGDFMATHILHSSEKLAASDPSFASFYLLTHGFVKVVLAIALWMSRLWAYPAAIAIFSLFSAYQVYRWAHTHSRAMLLLTIFDVLVIWLTWREYVAQKADRAIDGGEHQGPDH